MGNKKKTQEQFVSELKEVYGDKYDFSPLVYNGYRSIVSYICPTHGLVQSRADRLLHEKRGCPKCGIMISAQKRTYNRIDVINQAKETHNNKYDYSLITDDNYKDLSSKVPIICPEHGVFFQNMYSHVYKNNGCLFCGYESMSEKSKIKITTDEFKERANIIHDGFYDYSLVDVHYINDNVTIICPVHGQFFQKAKIHLYGHGCYECGREKTKKSLSQLGVDIKKKFSSIHQDKYDYKMIQDSEYYNNLSKVPIICSKHGVFYQSVAVHANGHGCPHCATSKGEIEVAKVLDELGIEYIKQYRVNNEDLFCSNRKLVFDFFLPSHNIVIEYNGKQHYKEIVEWRGQGSLEKQQKRDDAVRLYCKNHRLKLIEIPYTEYVNIKDIIKRNIKQK